MQRLLLFSPKGLLLLVSSLLWALPCLAQQTGEPEFEPDRPDFTESSRVVPRGYFQLETGYLFQKNRSEGIEEKLWLYPQALVRIGVFSFAELRLEATFRREDQTLGDELLQRRKGLSTVRIGTKVKALESQGALPEVSVLALVEVPWGEDAFEPRRIGPAARLLFTNALSEKVKLQYNLGYRREWGEDQMVNLLLYSASLGFQITDRFSLAAEFFGEKPFGSPAGNRVDLSLQFLVLPNLQLDAIAGTGVSSAAPDFFIGTGISVRFPR